MPDQVDLNIQKQKNVSALNYGSFLLIVATASFIFTALYAYSYYLKSSVNEGVINSIHTNREELHFVMEKVEAIISNDIATSHSPKNEIQSNFANITKRQDALNKEFYLKHLSKSEKEDYQSLLKNISKSITDLNGISTLILSQKKGVFENKEIISGQLKTNKHNVLESLNTLNSWMIDKSFRNSTTLIWTVLVTSILSIILVGIAYFKVIIPFKQNIQINIELAKVWASKIKDNQSQANQSELKRKESELFLKTKSAQVIKLQQSLEEIIHQYDLTNNSKKQIYYEVAAELEQLTVLLNTHFQIIDNQTDVSSHENWAILLGNLEELNNLISKLFNSAQTGGQIAPKQEVYLTPLISEVIISTPTKGNGILKQIQDLPTILTDELALKRVLLVFIKFISINCENDTIQISAVEKMNSCEIKFVGLPISFKKKWDLNSSQEGEDLDLMPFKLTHAINSINNRGGKVWTQFDLGENGVLIISWVL